MIFKAQSGPRVVRLLLAGGGMFAASLAFAATASSATAPSAAASDASHEKLRQLMQQVRPPAGAAPGGGYAPAEPPSAERLQERAVLLKNGEAALARLQPEAALQSFERAALILHAADTEIALVRAYMQSGQYRRALGFGAHTAGAHLDVVAGSALYAWLLHLGGQAAVAQRLLTEAEARVPGHPLMRVVQQQISSGAPAVKPDMLVLPTRLAPYADMQPIPSTASVVGSAILLAGGRHALMPAALLPRHGPLYVRNGMGQLSAATVRRKLPTVGAVLLSLQKQLPAPEKFVVDTGPVFAGRAGYAIEYVSTSSATPAWPIIRSGFLGRPNEVGLDQKLGIDMPRGPRGGPVFDATGRFIGLAITSTDGTSDSLVTAARIHQALLNTSGASLSVAAPASVPARASGSASVDAIYEDGLRTTLQVIGVP